MNTVVEIDLPVCELSYGETTSAGTCPAVLGVDSERKCFNSIRTCAARGSFTAGTKTLRFCMPSEDVSLRKDGQPVVVIPSIESVAITPAVINPGVDIGQRESVRVMFRDHPHSDAGLDKYLADRDYNPFERGTFWGKMRARYPSFEGFTLRLLRGDGDDLSNWTTYTYVVDAITGQSEQVSLVAKDVLILADKKKAQAPRISTGVLAAAITDADTVVTLSPAGIGDAEYPASGKVSLGGKEVCKFTRSGDTLTLVRAQSGTKAEKHDLGDIVQLVLIYDAMEPADIVRDLLVNYTPGIDPAWIPLSEWDLEVDQYIGRLYSAEIAEPTAVVDLLNELIEQVGLVFWWDAASAKINLRSLRPVSSDARLYDEDQILAGSFKATEQPSRRMSEVWTYYGLRNPLEPIDEARNYKAAIATIDPKANQDYTQPAIKKIFSRWIIDTNRAAASRLNSMLLSRYRDAPRKLSFSLYETIEQPPVLGGGFRIEAWSLQDDTGLVKAIPAQVTSIEPREDRFVVDAQESIFVEQEDLVETKLIFIDSDTFSINLRTLHDQIYSPPQSGDHVRCIIGASATVGSFSSFTPALTVGDWPASVSLEIVVNGRIQGAGGDGKRGLEPLSGATAGGTALHTRYAVTVTNNGQIYGGGGGGGGGRVINEGTDPEVILRGAGGGGGAGSKPGRGSPIAGQDGTSETGGAGGRYSGVSVGGAGGAPGQPGSPGGSGGTAGGLAGKAVDGESFVTYTAVGTILGPRVN